MSEKVNKSSKRESIINEPVYAKSGKKSKREALPQVSVITEFWIIINSIWNWIQSVIQIIEIAN